MVGRQEVVQVQVVKGKNCEEVDWCIVRVSVLVVAMWM
jgi:hypothetical protein